MAYPLVTKYGDDIRWINWKLEEVDGRLTKVPYYSKNNKASSTDPKTWTTYEEASQRADNGSNGFSGVAIVLRDKKLICIDIDHVVEDGKVKHNQAEQILTLLKKANSFTELSQSRTGLHIFMALDFEYVPIANRKEPFEIYSTGRYICTDGMSYDKVPKEVRTISTKEELEEILSITGYPWGKDIKQEVVTQTDVEVSLTNENILELMFNAKNGSDVKKLYEGDTSKYDDDDSRADMALLATLAFYTQKNAAQMEQLWLSSPLGQRKKTQNRQDYRTRSINNAIAECKKVYSPRKSKTQIVTTEFLTQHSKQHGEMIIPCKENVLIALRLTEGLYGKIRRNLWTDKTEILDIDGKWRPENDNDVNIIQSILANNYTDYALRTASESHVRNALLQYAMENAVDPAVDYFKSLVWDGTPRLDTWIKNTYNAKDHEEAYKAFGRQWLKGLVKRVIIPGCKFDNVLVLEGPQGLKKSMSLDILVGKDWHVELVTSPNNKDFFMLMQGKMVVEFSEGEIQDRASTKLLKSVITTTIDSYRSPYGRVVQDKPRRCVFAMSVNGKDYLKDETGNRRWLPVECGESINIEWLKENKEQLFAEAYHYAITLNENLYEGLDTEEVKEMQDERRLQRYEEARIVDWYQDRTIKEREEGYTLEEVFDLAIGKGEDKQNQMHNIVIPPILENILKLTRTRRVKNGKRKTLYTPTEETYKKFPVIELF